MSDSPIKVKCGGGDMRLSSCGTAILPNYGAANRWPSVGRTNGRPWGDPVDATSGENQWPPVGGRSDGRRHRGVKSRPAGPASLGGDMRLSKSLAANCWMLLSGQSRMLVRPRPVSVPLLERAPWVLGGPSSTLATDLDDGARFRAAIFEGSVFTGNSRSKLAPERSRPGTAGHVDWEHPMIFSFCRLPLFCVRRAGMRGNGPSPR